jgi:hypothetical protein
MRKSARSANRLRQPSSFGIKIVQESTRKTSMLRFRGINHEGINHEFTNINETIRAFRAFVVLKSLRLGVSACL